jgi:glycolate oxidase FAD binding subunit
MGRPAPAGVARGSPVLAALARAAGGYARAAGEGDAVDGVPARFVAAPGTTEEAGGVLRVAAEHDLAVVARGGGTKLGWGLPPRRLDLVVDTGRLDRVVEHAAGDLVVVVQAGVRLAALRDRLAGAGQQLAIDEVVCGSTVGGVVATGLSGPRRLLHGGVRDLILGATLVRADGVVARSGGKVVKNVAGYDVAKLVCGSYGTLGLVTEAAFRLHPVAPAAACVSVPAAGADEAHALALRALHAQFVPTAVEVDRPAAGGPVAVSLLVEGTAAGVEGRTRQALDLLGAGAGTGPQPPWWGRLPAVDGGVLVKLTTELGGLGRLLDGVDRAAAHAGLPVAVRGSAGVGALHAALPGADPAAVAAFVTALRRASPAWSGSVVVLSAPAAVRDAVDAWGPVSGLSLMRRVKDRFDPGSRLAPGRFVGGI